MGYSDSATRQYNLPHISKIYHGAKLLPWLYFQIIEAARDKTLAQQHYEIGESDLRKKMYSLPANYQTRE